MSAVLSFPEQNKEVISYNPATGEEIGRVENASAEQVRRAVDESRRAFQSWRKTTFAERKKIVLAAREVILAEMDEIARLISDESGKPVAEALSMEIVPVLDLMHYFAQKTERLLRPRRIDIGLYRLLGRSSKIVYQPLGVVGVIPAWNYPFSIPLGETVMALMAGNTVIIKPSELTPFVGLKIGEIFEKAGAPEAVVQVVTGAGATGAALVEAAPDKIMFTGSVATGKRIAAAAAENLTPVVLELGGKDPMIVFADADLELAASAAVWGAFCNAGQSCSSVERLYVEAPAAEKLTALIVEKTRKLKQGAGSDAAADIGAMSSERQLKIVADHVESFKKDGARVLTGGGYKDLFFEPTVIAGATNEMRAMREETFGPTLPIAVFHTEEEAVRLANDTEFGLTASVWTRDAAKGRRVAEQIEAGTVCINEVLYTHGIGQTPWGGFKNSGRGRTHGLEGLLELVQPQHIHVNKLPVLPDVWWFPYGTSAIETFKKFARYFTTGSVVRTSRLTPLILKRLRELRKK